MIESNHVVLWNRCLDVIKDNVPETTYNTWFAPIVPLKYEDKTLILQIPSQFFYEILEERFVDLIRKTLYKVIGEGTKLMYNVMVDKTSIPNQTVNLEASNRSTAVTPKSIIGGNKAPSFLQAPAVQDLDPHLNPNYNFENFIEGYSNKLSRSVAEAVAQKPGGTAFNPLFLYGASGVGKTHLANAIGTKIKEIYPEKRVLYVSAHLFQVQYTDSVRNNTTNDFINFYQTIDVLIIDDIQEFAGVTNLVAALIYLGCGVSLESYVGTVIACFILKSGFGMLRDTLNEILGERPDPLLVRQIKNLLVEEPEIRGAYDLMINNYGPGRNYASVHIELPDVMTVEQVDRLTHRIHEKVFKATGVHLSGVTVYSYNTRDPEAAQMREQVSQLVMKHPWALQVHGFYVDRTKKTMRFDVVVTFGRDREPLIQELQQEITRLYPDYQVSVDIDRDISALQG